MSSLPLSVRVLQTQPDSRLIALAREGHEPAFEALVRRYRKELLAYCWRLQPRSGSAEDAFQQALLQAWRALRAGAEVREARPWLYRIAHNVTVNHRRVVVAVPQEVAEEASEHDVHQLVELRLQAHAALAGVASLPGLQRDVFVSTTLDGASHDEVASALGLSSAAVRGLIYRARATLRSAAAALIPSPALHWAMRRAEGRAGGAPAISDALFGGGGASVAAAMAKGGVVLTLAGAVAGAGGVIITHSSSHRRSEVRLAGPSEREQARTPMTRISPAVDPTGSVLVEAALRSRSGERLGDGGSAAAVEPGGGSGSVGEDRGGSSGAFTGEHGGRSGGGSDGGSSAGSSGGSDGASIAGATASSVSGSGASSSGSDGGSPGSSGGSTSTTSGADGGTSGGGSGPSGGGQLTTAPLISDGGSGSDGGSTSSSPSLSGSGETTTTGSH